MQDAVKMQKQQRLKRLLRDRANWKQEFEKQMVEYIKGCPDLSYEQIADRFGMSKTAVAQIAIDYEIVRERGRKAAAYGAGK